MFRAVGDGQRLTVLAAVAPAKLCAAAAWFRDGKVEDSGHQQPQHPDESEQDRVGHHPPSDDEIRAALQQTIELAVFFQPV